MDAFYASVEQRDHPEWRGRPVIVGGDASRSVVATCSYEARVYGVRSAMPAAQARRLCPHAIFARPRMSVYVAESARIRGIFERYTDLVEPISLDEAFLDVTGSRMLFGAGMDIARRIKSDINGETGLTVSIGVASSKYVAKVASDLEKPDGLVEVSAEGTVAFLAALPVSRLWGAGPRTQERLTRLGFRTIGDIQACGLETLQRMVGVSDGAHFHRMALGMDDRPVVPERDGKSVSQERTFGEDLVDRVACHQALIGLSDAVGRRLRRQGIYGRTVRIKVRYGDFTTYTRQCGVGYTRDDFVIREAALRLFDALWPGHPGIRLLGVGVDDLVGPGEVIQGDLFEDGERDRSDSLLAALDAIRDRFGSGAIRHGGAFLGSGKRRL
jgi:DNA polymerase-4